jgi:hypothetical protein
MRRVGCGYSIIELERFYLVGQVPRPEPPNLLFNGLLSGLFPNLLGRSRSRTTGGTTGPATRMGESASIQITLRDPNVKQH